jgi:predicted small lipoprotein YifL
MKKAVSLIALILAILTLAACGPKTPVAPVSDPTAIPTQAGSTQEAAVESDVPDDPPAEPDYSYTFDPNTDCRNLTAVLFPDGLAETEDVFYWRAWRSSYLYYGEKTGYNYGALCGKPDCEHDMNNQNTDCNAYIANRMLPQMYVYNGKLYFIERVKEPGMRAASMVSYMDLDGTNRKRLFMVDEEERAYQQFYVHRGKAFLVAETELVVDGKPCKKFDLCCGDLEGDGVEPVYEEILPANTYYTYGVSFFGDHAFLFFGFFGFSGVTSNVIYAYDLVSGSFTKVAYEENSEFNIGCLYVDTDGEIYVCSSALGRPTQPAVYKVANGGFEKLFEFEGEEYYSDSVRLANGLALCCLGDFDLSTLDTIWVKDMKGNTVYKGAVSRDFLEGRENVVVGMRTPTTDGTSIIYTYEGWIEGDPDGQFLVRYEFTDGGLKETLIAER